MPLHSLWQRMHRQTMLRPERVDFFMLLLIERGQGTHMVDFAEFPMRPGSLVFVKPGQVQQWHPPTHVRGLLLLADPPVMNPDTTRSALQHTLAREWPTWPTHRVLPSSARPVLHRWLRQLVDECARFDDGELSIALMRSMLACLLLQVARIHAGSPASGADTRGPEPALSRLLLAALEAHLRSRPTVQSLAAELGYSVSTLNRACLVAEGRTAKAVIDRRVLLEAQRLLVHSHDAAAQIGLSLGFSEPSNFHKFFRRVAGCTPDEFRQRYAGRT